MFQFSAPGFGVESPVQFSSEPKSQASAQEKRQITRSRISYSCVTCRRRKVKCDKIHPVCGGCQKANEQCVYTDEKHDASSAVSKWEDSAGQASKRRRASPARSTSQAATSASTSSEDATPPAQLRIIEEQLHNLTSMIGALRNVEGKDPILNHLANAAAASSQAKNDRPSEYPKLSLDMFQSAPRPASSDNTELSKPLSSLNLRDCPKVDPFWNHISDELDQLNNLMRRRHNKQPRAPAVQSQKNGRVVEDMTPYFKEREAEREDFWEPISFHKESGVNYHSHYSPDATCPICCLTPFTKSTLLQGIPVRSSALLAKQHLLKGIPTRAQSNALFRCWLSGIHPLIPILLPSQMLAGHEDFWAKLENSAEQNGDASGRPDIEFISLLYAIWYAGVLSISEQGFQRLFPGISRAKVCSQFHDQVVFCLHLAGFTRNPNLKTLAAYIMLQSLPAAEEDPVQSSLYVQLAVRLGLTMGLHREPTLFNLSAAEEGTRRRLWWQIVQMDLSLVVAAGYPSQISEAFSDTRINCEDRDANWTSEDVRNGSSKGGVSHPGYGASPYKTIALVARARSILACALRKIISTHLSTKAITNADMQEMRNAIQEAENEVNDIIKQIPSRGLPEMGFTPDVPREFSPRAADCEVLLADTVDPGELGFYTALGLETEVKALLSQHYRRKLAAFNKWARISLSMLNDKMHCVAYAPFLKNTKSKLWSAGRQCALHNCHSFLRKMVSIASDKDLEPFRWTWPSLYQPMHAILIALVDLYERPDSVEAPRSRELVDQIFSFSGPNKGIVGGPNGVSAQRPLREGGVEPWDMLRGLRSAAWQKAGLDPRVLWTAADQEAVGAATPLTEPQRVAQSLREDTIYENDRHPAPPLLPNGKKTTAAHEPTDTGVRYLVRLAEGEFDSGSKPPSYPCGRSLRNQFLQEIENDTRLKPARRLARREGQEAMPFPLSGTMETCTGHAAELFEHPPAHVLQMNTHIPRPATECGGPWGDQFRPEPPLSPPDSDEHPLRSAAPSTQASQDDTPVVSHHPEITTAAATANTNGDACGGNYEQWIRDIDADLASRTAAPTTPATAAVAGKDGAITVHHQNGFQQDPSPQYQQVTPVSQSLGDEHGLKDGDLPIGDSDLGFDWERWDAVFGQYSGFTDLMEDVTFEGLE